MSAIEAVEKLVAHWNSGAFSNSEFVSRLLEAITPENVAVVCDQSAEIVSMLAAEVSAALSTESEWREMFLLESDCGSEEAANEKARRHALQLANYRRGVETVRNWYLSGKYVNNGRAL